MVRPNEVSADDEDYIITQGRQQGGNQYCGVFTITNSFYKRLQRVSWVFVESSSLIILCIVNRRLHESTYPVCLLLHCVESILLRDFR